MSHIFLCVSYPSKSFKHSRLVKVMINKHTYSAAKVDMSMLFTFHCCMAYSSLVSLTNLIAPINVPGFCGFMILQAPKDHALEYIHVLLKTCMCPIYIIYNSEIYCLQPMVCIGSFNHIQDYMKIFFYTNQF